jgi:hypothetical protein
VIAALHTYPAAGWSELKPNNKNLLIIVEENWSDIVKNDGKIKNADDWMSFFKKIFRNNSEKKI